MRPYCPPPRFQEAGPCPCSSDEYGHGTLYFIESLHTPVYVCTNCGFAGPNEGDTCFDDGESLPEHTERIHFLEDLLARAWEWVGVRAPRTVTSKQSYRQLVREIAAVVRHRKMRDAK